MDAGTMDFVPCVKWVPKGAVQGTPQKVEFTREELQQIINEARPEDSEEEMIESDEEDGRDRYDMEHYDEPSHNESNSLGIGSLALYEPSARDPHVNIPGMDDRDSDDDDDEIKPEDNLIVVGKGFRDNSGMESIEIHVYNEEDNNMYAHHDIMVSSCPLCFEIINVQCDDNFSCFIATGLLSASVELYDLNVFNPVKPQAKLGSKKKIKEKGHTDAVLDLSWNRQYSHILASSSADKTIALWDLETITLSDRYEGFDGNVENIQWENDHGHCLLSSDSSGIIKLFDCRCYSTVKEWSVKGEALIARWSACNSNHFFVGSSKGRIFHFDSRSDGRIFSLKAHESDVTGISPISGFNGLLVSTCVGGDLKVWDTNTDPPRAVFNKSFDVEQLHTLDLNPDNPLIAAVGGAKKKGHYFSTLNLNKKNCINDLLSYRRATT